MQLPNPLDGILRVSSIKILRLTVSSYLSVSEHVSSVIGRCAQTIHALRILRSQGLCGGAENAGPENDGPRKLQGLKMQDLENDGPYSRA